jgi:hypothetical protein
MALAVVMASGLALAQDQAPPAPPQPQQQQTPGAWRHMGDDQTQTPQANPQANPPATGQAANPEPVERVDVHADTPQRNAPPAYSLPAQLTLKPGTYINVRINQTLSSDKNQTGDTFTAILVQPVIVDGIVVAPRGQTVYGRVLDAAKAHGGKDSRLGLEMNSLRLADGTQAPIHSQLVAMQGPQYPGSAQPGTVVNTPAADAAAVMMTHNHPTILSPGVALTFNITTPVAINTANAPGAYRYVGPEDYQNNSVNYAAPAPRPAGSSTYVYGGPGYPYGYPYYSPYYPYYWGPGFGIGFGPRFYGGFGGFGRRFR